MSKIGKKPIIIPENVKIKLEDRVLLIEGPRGRLNLLIPREIKTELSDKSLIFSNSGNSKRSSAIWGTTRALAENAIKGVYLGFEKNLEIEGIGLKVQKDGRDLILNLGFSHTVKFPSPEGIDISVEKNKITISGIDKALVGNTAACIRALKKPEPYKGKGIRYKGEIIRRKAGKKASGSGGTSGPAK